MIGRLSPSAAHRWLACPGSVRLCAEAPYVPPGPYAMAGSIAHYAGEMALRHGLPVDDYLGKQAWYTNNKVRIGDAAPASAQYSLPMDAMFLSAVQMYVDEINRKRALVSKAAVFKQEEKLDMSWLGAPMSGTADAILIDPMFTLFVDDYKHGYGIVEPDAPQLKIYGLGALGEDNWYGVEEVVLTIIQPNAPHHDGNIRSHTMSTDELLSWHNTVLKPGIEATQKPDAKLDPGAHCKYCNAIDSCPAVRGGIAEISGARFDTQMLPVKAAPTLPSVQNLSGEQLDRALGFADVFAQWYGSLKAEAFERLKNQHPDPPNRYKLVEGRKTRKWTATEPTIHAALSPVVAPANLYDTKLKSVAQMEQMLKRLKLEPELIAPFVGVTRAVTMASIEDRRKSVAPSIDEMFEAEGD